MCSGEEIHDWGGDFNSSQDSALSCYFHHLSPAHLVTPPPLPPQPLCMSLIFLLSSPQDFVLCMSSYIHDEGLAHVIMEAGKSHQLLSVSWRPRKAHCVVQCELAVLRNRRADVLSLSLRAEDQHPSSSLKHSGKRSRFSLPMPFVPFSSWLI